MHLIDTHVHLYEDEFKDDLESVIEKAKLNGIGTMLMPNVDKHSISAMKTIAGTYPKVCLPMIGLHPCYVKEDYLIQLEEMRAELDTSPYVAIGEIGLDLYWDKSFYEQQKEAFLTQLQWGKEKGLPIAIHSREATRQAIDLLAPLSSEKLRGVFHCFSGTLEEAKEIIEMGFFLGIGGVATFKNAGMDKLLPELPLEKIVLETDAPYLAPVPFRGKRNESSYLSHIAKRVAEIYQLPLEEIARRTTQNAEMLFGIDSLLA